MTSNDFERKVEVLYQEYLNNLEDNHLDIVDWF